MPKDNSYLFLGPCLLIGSTAFDQIKSNYWFSVQTFIREDDSDAQKKQISRRMQQQKFQS